jgi:hypothetical protein
MDINATEGVTSIPRDPGHPPPPPNLAGLNSLMKEILLYMAMHPDQMFGVKDIMTALRGDTGNSTTARFWPAVMDLVNHGLVEAAALVKSAGGPAKKMYRFRHDIGRIMLRKAG